MNYDDNTWAALGKKLYDTLNTIHVHNRAQVINNLVNNTQKYKQKLSQ